MFCAIPSVKHISRVHDDLFLLEDTLTEYTSTKPQNPPSRDEETELLLLRTQIPKQDAIRSHPENEKNEDVLKVRTHK